MKKRESFLVLIVGILGIINLLLILKNIFLAWDCFLVNDWELVFSKLIGSICLYVDTNYLIKQELWVVIRSLLFSVGSVIFTIGVEKYTNVKYYFDNYFYISINTYVGIINFITAILFLSFSIYFLKLYEHSFLIRLRVF